jgi:hypothetical protein
MQQMSGVVQGSSFVAASTGAGCLAGFMSGATIVPATIVCRGYMLIYLVAWFFRVGLNSS